MTLQEHLEAEATQTESFFRAALAREDLLRLGRLRELAHASDDRSTFIKEALYIGWTTGDLMSRDLKPALEPFTLAFWQVEREQSANDLLAAWHTFNAERMRILIHCL